MLNPDGIGTASNGGLKGKIDRLLVRQCGKLQRSTFAGERAPVGRGDENLLAGSQLIESDADLDRLRFVNHHAVKNPIVTGETDGLPFGFQIGPCPC